MGTPIDTIPYTYSDATWGDLLTAYDCSSRTYDDVGNLWTDGTWAYTWQNGRELVFMIAGDTAWSIMYDANGMRTDRTFGTTAYKYVYNGSQLVEMTVGDNTLHFTYGLLGPTTVTWNGTTYYYALNVQGDVVGIFDGTGNPVVSYTWDNAWGYNPMPEGVMASTLGTLNPLRYRGYVYDTETGLYYLESRYYDPEIGRFINADAFTSTGQGLTGANMYAYCGNNPVCRADTSGELWFAVVAVVTVVNIAYAVNNWAHTKSNAKLNAAGYIYNQNQGIASQYKFGFFSSSHNGCGWIATYNALIMLGNPQKPEKIISYYEKRGALLWGAAGILPTAVGGYFRSRGYKVTVTTNTSKFDARAKNNTANVLFYWHGKGAHNIAVHWNGEEFIGYNVFSDRYDSVSLGSSIKTFLRRRGFTCAILTSIS